MGVLDGGGDRQMGRGSFGGKCGASHCNQWVLCVIAILYCEGGDMDLPKLLWDFFFLLRKCNNFTEDEAVK